MKAEVRRREILSLIGNVEVPLTASVLKEKFKVSRQVIVKDIAVLRANGYDIIATNKGYILSTKSTVKRVFKCRHTFEEMVEEGFLIIDCGGRIDEVFVNHRVYGRISARIDLTNRMHVEELYRSLFSGASKPLMSVTDGYHYHTVSANSEQALNEIEKKLKDRGFLIEI
ncbi:MAG: transcription repressor NadR [Clostridiales bacterium]|nr:transcription repressor NadR [Clostridiales bacterium]